ncbi:MAG: toll/interleukin-1 receptor domain-containing protein [Muribaculaceae bacterium]|nr:toll/interleukin-1 receptor domain-containing protein [Muribaculaceae bacterium]
MAKVFLSHSSKDKPIVDLFKSVLLNVGLGIADEDIAYTSAVETGVPIGGNIPQFIKSNIGDSDFVFLFISENYRHSEVCLNEMGAAWALDRNVKPLLIHDNLPFDSVGWLYHMSLCARLSDPDMLDELRDEFLDKYPYRTKTAVWNRQKAEFLTRLKQLVPEQGSVNLNIVSPAETEEELGLLDYREQFDEQNAEFINLMARITEGLNTLAPRVGKRTQQLTSAVKGTLNTQQTKGIMKALARDYDQFSAVLEECIPLANDKYNALIDSAKLIQETASLDEETKKDNRQAYLDLLDQLIEARKAHVGMRDSLKDIPHMEKTQIKAKHRTLTALDSLIEAMDSWITRTSELLKL